MAKKSDVVIGLLAGAAIGATLGILFAPDKGKNTRRRLKKNVEDYTDRAKSSVQNAVGDVKNEANDIYSRLRKKMRKMEEETAELQEQLEDAE